MADQGLTDADIGLSDEDIGLQPQHAAASGGLTDADIGLSDADIGLQPQHAAASGGLTDADIGLSDADIGLGPTKTAPEGFIASNVRAAAHGIIPAAGAVVGGAAAGALAGTLGAGPIGTIVGGIVGGIAGGLGGDVAQDKLQENIPAIDDRAQMEADREAYPKSTTISGMLPFAGNPGQLAGSMAQRVAGGAMLGGLDVAQQAYQKGSVDPTQSLEAGAFGAVFPNGNRVTRALHAKVEDAIPGRPNKVESNPDAAQAHEDVGDESPEVTSGDWADSQQPPRPTGETVGAPPENSPTNSQGEVATGKADGSYAKNQPAAADQSSMTSGDMSPDVGAALKAAGEDNGPSPQPSQPPQQRPLGMPAPNYQPPKPEGRPPFELQQQPEQGPQAVETGFPKPGEPVAMGENDATPFPPGTPERAAAAIEKSQAAQAKGPPIEGRAAEPTPAQAEAGNYKLARIKNDFGKPISIETHAGDVRQGKGWEHVLPYDYGYFNKTKGPDGDHIDFIRPADGAPERGDKHYIIDQKNPETGKYDEPKVMTYVKDEATARDLYARGFGDGRGPDRLHDITEVDRGQLVKFLAKHSTKPPTRPYGKPIEKPVAERAVVKDLIAKGKITAEEIAAMPREKVEAAIAGKRTRNYGVKGGYPVEGLANEVGEPVTANTKAKAAERSAAHKAVSDWFKESTPPSQMDISKETPAETLARLKGHSYPQTGGWVPGFKPKEWLLAREAKKTLAKPTPGSVEKYREAERMLRGGDEAVDTYRRGNRIEGDIANSRRSGDEAVANAEAEQHLPGRNDVEDKILENIARKRGDVDATPDDEPLPVGKPRQIKTAADLPVEDQRAVKVSESRLAEQPKTVKPKPVTKQTLAELTAAPKVEPKKEGFEPAKAASKGESVKSKFTAEDMQRMIDLANKASKRTGLSDAEIAKMDFGRMMAEPPRKAGEHAELPRRLGPQRNEAGSAPQSWMAKTLEKLLGKTTPLQSYRAKDIKTPTNKYINDEFERMHLHENKSKLEKQDIQRQADVIGREADRGALERMFKAREADSAHVDLPGKLAGKTNVESLGPADKKVWDTHIQPLLDEAEELKELVRKLNPKFTAPDVEHYIARIMKGDTHEFNLLRENDDPTGPESHGFKVTDGMMQDRGFYALERKVDGKRTVIMPRENGFTAWENQKATRIKAPGFAFEANAPYQVKGKNGPVDYIMRHATTDEIMKSGAKLDLGSGKTQPVKYYQNAAMSALLARAKMGEVARNMEEITRIQNRPEFLARVSRSLDDKPRGSTQTARQQGYITTRNPNFEGYHMDPRLAHLLDDYSKPGFDTPQALRQMSQAVTKMLFWMPVAHLANVGTHWTVGRGFDWVTPQGIVRLAKTAPEAIRSVISQDARQQRYMEHNAGLIYPSIETRRFMETTVNAVHEDMVKNPSKWGPVADAFKVPLEKLSRAVYDNSSKIMWMGNDMFLTQRIMELEMKGMSTEQAIKSAERDIPNYRVPPQLFSGAKHAPVSRFLTQGLTDPVVSSFGRYHVGMFTSYANIFKDAFGKNSTLADRVDAAGKLMVMGALAFGVYPLMDKFAQMVTGNEDAEQNRRGPLAIPYHVNRALQGKEDIASAGRSTFTIPPLWSTVLETYSNKDFRGKAIVEPGDVAKGKYGKAAVQEGEHALRGLFSPYGTFATAEKKGTEAGVSGVAKSTGRAIRDQALDVKDPSPNAARFARKQSIINDKNARYRDRKGGYGPAEELFDKLGGK